MEIVKLKLEHCLKTVNLYKDLLNSYNLDFYVDNHWNILPQSWRQLETRNICELYEILLDKKLSKVFPLSIIALQQVSKTSCIQRNDQHFKDEKMSTKPSKAKEKLQKALKRKMKPKKLHEVQRMSKICDKIATKSGIKNIIDFGSGLGHLSRNLAFNHNYNVCCIERQTKFIEDARKLDDELSRRFEITSNTLHINTHLDANSCFQEILKTAQCAFDSNESFGLIGLHPCGDLAVLLLKTFLKHPEIQFINIVGCCYMKLTIESKIRADLSFPLSNYLINSNTKLSYEMLEVSCHANEKYAERLRNDDYQFLKVHSYRAALEKIIVKHRFDLRHSGLLSIQHKENLTFEMYCEKALKHYDFKAPSEDIFSKETAIDLNNWKQVVVYFTLRMMLAPFIESIVLYDRILFLMENHCEVDIFPAFSSVISPRCHVTTAIKKF